MRAKAGQLECEPLEISRGGLGKDDRHAGVEPLVQGSLGNPNREHILLRNFTESCIGGEEAFGICFLPDRGFFVVRASG
jgi:hypothetical protein